VCEHVGQDLGAVGGVLTDGRVLTDGLQEVSVGVRRVFTGEERVKLGFWENRLNILDIGWV